METRSLAEKGVGAKTRCHKFIMINTSARRATRGRDATRRCIYLSLCARMTESDEIPKRDGRETRVYDFRTNRSPGGCCARVRINLRLLVKIRALSFHLCVRARELIRSFGCVQYACQGRVLVVLVGHLHKTPSKERSGTPVDFLPREREREMESAGNPWHSLAFYLFWSEKRKSWDTQLAARSNSILWRHVLSFLERRGAR